MVDPTSTSGSSHTPTGITHIVYLPHGTMTLDPTLHDLPPKAADIHHLCHAVGQATAEQQYDAVVLMTPHGLAVDETLGVYNPGARSSAAHGTGLWCGGWSEFTVDVELDGQLAQDVYQHLKHDTDSALPPIAAIRSFGGISTPLRWAELVPLYFTLQYFKGAQVSADRKQVKTTKAEASICILSVPRASADPAERDVFRSKQMAMNAVVGRSLDAWAAKSGKRVLLLVSGDQSHVHVAPKEVTHPKYIPDPSSTFHFNTPLAQEFDTCWNQWVQLLASDKQHAQQQVDKALTIDDKAMCCGLSGMLTINGLVQSSSAEWSVGKHGYYAPTYYGMLAFILSRK